MFKCEEYFSQDKEELNKHHGGRGVPTLVETAKDTDHVRNVHSLSPAGSS